MSKKVLFFELHHKPLANFGDFGMQRHKETLCKCLVLLASRGSKGSVATVLKWKNTY